MKRKPMIIVAVLGVIIVLGGAVLMFVPIEESCGAPGATCAYQNPEGQVCRSYDVQPVAVSIMEALVQKDLGIQYSTGTRCE